MILVITKQNGNFFSLQLNDEDAMISEQNRLTTVGNYCNFKTASGANLIQKQRILFSDITIVTSSSYVPTSIIDLWINLIDADFFKGVGISSGGNTINRFDELLDTFSYFGRDGQVLVVNESQLRLETQAITLFSEADKTKLDGIEENAQVNINPDWNSTDPNSKATILNKPTINSFFSDTYNEVFLGQNSNVITLPIGVRPLIVMVDRGVRYVASEYTITDNILTILGDTLDNADVYVVGMQQ
jgi:hypothetical protein